jgi:aspartyl-tRNA(Asn)/glutamyl-tRNA(Gln) amidotransferase subunit C
MDARYIAQLARLELSIEEERRLGTQVDAILGFVEQLKEVDIDGVEPTAHAIPQYNVTRADEVQSSLSQEEALLNAPVTADGLFIVPRIVE